MGVRLSWRNVFECKTPGERIWIAAEKARAADYPFMVHNNRVYEVPSASGADPLDTGLTIEDVQ